MRDPREPELLEPVNRAELRVQLEEWTSTVFEIGGLSIVELRHDKSRGSVTKYAYRKGETTLDDLKERIARAAENDAKNLERGGPQSYKVEAYFGDQTFPTMYCRLRCKWADSDDENDFDAATGHGKKGDALMRHHAADAFDITKKAFKYVLQHGLKSEAQKLQLIDRLLDRIEKLETELETAFKAVQEAEDRKQERELRAKMAAELRAAARELFDVAKVFAPVLVNHAIGEKVLPVSDAAHPILELMTQLYDAITTDDATQSAVLEALSKSKPATMAFGALISKIGDVRDLAKARAAFAAKAEAEAATAAITTAAPKTNGHIVRGPFARGTY